jgi:hypothetical protein
VKRHHPARTLIAFTVLLVVSLGCSFLSGPQPTPAPQQPPTLPPQQQQVSEPTPLPQEQPSPIPPTEAPPPTAVSQQFFTKEFDNGSSNWSPFVTNGKLHQLDLSAKDGRLVFAINERQVWSYAVYTPQTYQDVKMEVQAENFGNNENNVTMICRYSERGWYEVTISNNGLYKIYFGKWDDNGTTASYAKIADGGSTNILAGRAVNTYAFSCKGTMLTLTINGKEIKRVEEKQRGLREGQIGIGVSSFRYVPVEVQFDWVKITQP